MTTRIKDLIALLALAQGSQSLSQAFNGRDLYLHRCAMCHGSDLKGTGPLAKKSNPPTPDLTTLAFKRRLSAYPGVIISSVILQPNGDLIPRTLKNNGVNVPPRAWSVKDFRDINRYMVGIIIK